MFLLKIKYIRVYYKLDTKICRYGYIKIILKNKSLMINSDVTWCNI